MQKPADPWAATDYRNENWHPEKGLYFFSETWTWEYLNENLPADDPFHKGELTIAIDPPTGTMLLRRGDAYHMGEMIDWMIIEPQGIYITHWTDHDGSTLITRDTLQNIDEFDFYLSHQPKEFETYFEEFDHELRKFNWNEEGRRMLEAFRFEQTFAMSADTSQVYLAVVPFSVRPLFFVNTINEEMGLPPLFDAFGYILPDTLLPMKESISFYGKKYEFSLKSIYETTFFIDLNEK